MNSQNTEQNQNVRVDRASVPITSEVGTHKMVWGRPCMVLIDTVSTASKTTVVSIETGSFGPS